MSAGVWSQRTREPSNINLTLAAQTPLVVDHALKTLSRGVVGMTLNNVSLPVWQRTRMFRLPPDVDGCGPDSSRTTTACLRFKAFSGG